MCNERALAFLLLVTAGAGAPGEAQTPTPIVVPTAAPDEVIVFEKPFYRGPWMRLRVGDALPDLRDTPDGNWELTISSVKVGSEAVAVLYAGFGFRSFCLGLPGRSLGGAGYYPELATVKNRNLRTDLNDKVRSLRVVGKDANLATVCEPLKR
jgi:hypothetical protein